MNERLIEARQEGVKALRNLSERLNNSNGESKLDCTGVFSLNKDELTALFQYIRFEWRESAEFRTFIKMDVLNDTKYDVLLDQFTEYVGLNPLPPEPTINTTDKSPKDGVIAEKYNSPKSINYYKVISALGGLIIIVIGIIKSWDYFTKPKISNGTITIGILTGPADYRELSDYLRKELVPANYFDYFQGKQVGIIIEGM
jgi:hypothetical protein